MPSYPQTFNSKSGSWGGGVSNFLRKMGNPNLFRKKAELISFVEGLNIPVIDIHQEVFADHPKSRSLFPGGLEEGHYNADGYSLVAKAIVAGVRRLEIKE